jgi:hypothetical protein
MFKKVKQGVNCKILAVYIYMQQYKYKTPASTQYIVGCLCANNFTGLQAAIYVCIYYRHSRYF